jgi:hypothetical protein
MRALIVFGMALAGCGKDREISVELRQEGDELERLVTSDSDDIPSRIEEGGFSQRYTSPFGDAWVYSEVLPSDEPLADVVAKTNAAADRVVDHAMGWMRWELDELDFAARAERVDTLLRLLVKEAALNLALPFDPSVPEAPGVPLFANLLLETKLVTLSDVPELLRLSERPEADESLEGFFLVRLRRIVAEVCGVEEDHEALAFFASPEAFADSWRTWLEKGGSRSLVDSPSPDSGPWDALEDLFEVAFDLQLFSDQTRVAFTLETGSAPVLTNGTFDPATGLVSWPKTTLEHGSYRPLHRYAVWVRPDRRAQRERFGRTLLVGDALFQYALWHVSLTTEQREEWEALLASDEPGVGLLARIAAFRFANRKADKSVGMGAEALRKALEAD